MHSAPRARASSSAPATTKPSAGRAPAAVTAGSARAGSLPSPAGPGEQLVELGVGRGSMVEERVEGARFLAEVVGEALGIERAAEPFETDQAIDRRREVEPWEWILGHRVHAPVADGPHLAPSRVGAHVGAEASVHRDDHVGIPREDLLERHGGEPGSRRSGDYIARAEP